MAIFAEPQGHQSYFWVLAANQQGSTSTTRLASLGPSITELTTKHPAPSHPATLKKNFAAFFYWASPPSAFWLTLKGGFKKTYLAIDEDTGSSHPRSKIEPKRTVHHRLSYYSPVCRSSLRRRKIGSGARFGREDSSRQYEKQPLLWLV